MSEKTATKPKKKVWSAEKKQRVAKENAQLLVAFQQIDNVVFDKKQPKPLELGIHEEAKNLFPGASKKAIDRFFAWWCNRSEYHQSVVDGHYRYSMNLKSSGKISESEKDNSLIKLENRIKKTKKGATKQKPGRPRR